MAAFIVALIAFNIGGVFALFDYQRGIQWRMYNGYAMKTCHVQLKDGQGAPIDRYALLGHKVPTRAPRSVRKIRDKRDLNKLAAQLCTKTKAVHATLVCGHRKRGWRTVDDGKKNLCAAR